MLSIGVPILPTGEHTYNINDNNREIMINSLSRFRWLLEFQVFRNEGRRLCIARSGHDAIKVQSSMLINTRFSAFCVFPRDNMTCIHKNHVNYVLCSLYTGSRAQSMHHLRCFIHIGRVA